MAGVIASVIGAYYYLRIVFFMYFGDADEERLNGGRSPVLYVMLMATALIMVVGIINMLGVEGAAAAAAAALVN